MSAEAESADPDRDDARQLRQQAGNEEFVPVEVVPDWFRVQDPYGVPRRFDLATLFSVTIAYALLFGVLSAARGPNLTIAANALLLVIVPALVTIVGASQALLFKGRRPRTASIVTGIVILLGLSLAANVAFRPPDPAMACSILGSVPFGALVGYAAGGGVAGVFLVADAIRKRLPRRQEPVLGDIDDDEPFR